MGFFVLGLNHKSCPVEIREKLAFRDEDVLRALALWREQGLTDELVILSTCNRVEFYGHSTSSVFPRESLLRLIFQAHRIDDAIYGPYLYQYENQDMVRHLFRVAAGLDSLVVGENEILGQLREAFRFAVGERTVHGYLFRLMEKSLKTGKSVRTETRINEGAVSVPSVAVELAEKVFGKLSQEKIMVIGAGEMSTQTLKSLRNAGAASCFVVSRNPAQGEPLAKEFGGTWIPFEKWESSLLEVDILITSTACPHPFVEFTKVQEVLRGRKTRPLFVIDIAVPRNVDPKIDTLENVHLYNIDDLRVVADGNLKMRQLEIQSAEELVEEAVTNYGNWMEQIKSRPILERFEKKLEEILGEELAPLFDACGQNGESRELVLERIRTRLLSGPYEKLKEAVREGDVRFYLQALEALFLEGDKTFQEFFPSGSEIPQTLDL